VLIGHEAGICALVTPQHLPEVPIGHQAGICALVTL